MDAVSDPSVKSVVCITSAQVGKTESILNCIGFHIAQDPAPILVVQPTLSMAQSFSKDRLAPMLRDIPALKGGLRRKKWSDLRERFWLNMNLGFGGIYEPRKTKNTGTDYQLST